ncbi:27974_t:CDS:2, partial [Gigaspora margarita]
MNRDDFLQSYSYFLQDAEDIPRLLSDLIFTSEVYDMSLQYNNVSLENYIDLDKFYNDRDNNEKDEILLSASLELKEYQNSVPTRGLLIASQVIFFQIDSILIKFVTPYILSIQRQQMNESLLYRAACLEVSEFNNNELESNISDSNFTEDLNDYPRIPLSIDGTPKCTCMFLITIATNVMPLPEEMHNQFNLEYLKQMRSNNIMSSEMLYNI